jgi:hypothetical protein
MERPLFLLSIVSLGLGGLLAFLVALARTPILYKLFPPGYFYHASGGTCGFGYCGLFAHLYHAPLEQVYAKEGPY